ncbi:unnamed protein product [Prorocentrum cordatum]|uniref:Co-chaperone DjlA N-terminal domain-containing protein n=1 Tax=Prorocentrum cordatum TaxID=2364126 RepID=A0ABN9UYZ4_9DINO|nr:unnamed protein product [Polarella glacialis]
MTPVGGWRNKPTQWQRHRDAGLFAAIAECTMRSVGEFVAHDVCAISWGFAAAGVADRRLFEALAEHALSKGLVRRLSPPLAAELAWGFAAAGVRHAPLFAELESLCLSHAEEMETEDAAVFAWAFTAAGMSDSRVFRVLAAYADRFEGRLRPGEADVMAWALAEAQVHA